MEKIIDLLDEYNTKLDNDISYFKRIIEILKGDSDE